MRFQKTTEYAIRVMVFLAANNEDVYSVNRLHKLLNIPYKYLGRLMNKLTQADFVTVAHGKKGGYRLNTSRQPVYLYQIIGLVEGLENYDRCILGFESCCDDHPCPMHKIWLPFKADLRDMIYNTTLEDLEMEVAGKHKKTDTAWLEGEPDWIRMQPAGIIDGTGMLSRGEHPLNTIIVMLREIKPGQIILLKTNFKPIPLIDEMTKQKYEVFSKNLVDKPDQHLTFIRRP